MRLYYFHDGKTERGPYKLHELPKEKLTTTTPIWYKELVGWTTVEKIPEVASIIQTSSIINARSSFSAPLPISNSYHYLKKEPPQKNYKRPLVIVGGLVSTYLLILLIINFSKTSGQPDTPQMEQAKVEKDDQEEEQKRINEALTTKYTNYRNNWYDYISAETDNYRYSNSGIIDGLEIMVRNNTECLLDEVIAIVSSIKANGDIPKTIEVLVTDVPGNDYKTVFVADVKKGTSAEVSIKSIVSKKMYFYMAEGYSSGNPEDPYFKK